MEKMAKDVAQSANSVADMLLEVVMKVDLRVPIARKGVAAN